MLKIKNLVASVEGKQILKGLNLEVGNGEVHAIMGPNGSGKSTLASVLAGREDYEVDGEITYDGKIFLIFLPKNALRQECSSHFSTPLKSPASAMLLF